jgi:PAS domain S-box-containing protein
MPAFQDPEESMGKQDEKSKDDLLRELEELSDRLDRVQGAQEALRASEERYRRLFEDDLTGDYTTTVEGRVLSCNPAFIRIFGFSSMEKAVGSNIRSSFASPKDWDGLIAALVGKSKLEERESVRVRQDGRKIDVVENAAGTFDPNGRLVEVKCYTFDNTERKRAERALRESEERYRRLFEDDLTGDYIARPDGTIAACNPAFLSLFGYSSLDEALQSNLQSTYPAPAGWDEFISRLRERRKLEQYEHSRRRRDGRTIHVVENAVGTFNEMGDLLEVKGYAFDDTERKRAVDSLRSAEERYRSLVELIPDAVWVSDAEHVWFANPAAARLLGAETPGELVGRPLLGLFPQDAHERIAQRTELAIQEGTVQPPERRKLVRLDGRTVDVETTAAPCSFDDRTAVIRVSRDITERILAEEALLAKDREITRNAEKVEKLNTALQVLLDQRELEMRQKEENVRATLEKLVFPHMEDLKGTRMDDEQRIFVELLEANLTNISSSFARRLATWHEKLTPTEIRVADLIMEGRRTKEIADILKVSCSAVAFHRSNIRAKLGLRRKSTNLVSFLRHMGEK